MPPGELLTRWTVRVALALYVAALTLRMTGGSWRFARLAWALGCGFFVLHIVSAFHFHHHWSHAHAYVETARQTGETIGLYWGGGIYVNHVFMLVWLFDAAWWWAQPHSYLARPRWIEWAVRGFMAFIAFNATVVFGAGVIRWFGGVTCALFAVLFWFGRDRAALPDRGRPSSQPSPHDGWPRQ